MSYYDIDAILTDSQVRGIPLQMTIELTRAHRKRKSHAHLNLTSPVSGSWRAIQENRFALRTTAP